jgi:aminoglycoside phosphotransferase (APT) family kinase protein
MKLERAGGSAGSDVAAFVPSGHRTATDPPDIRDVPTAAFIAAMRERYPTEREVDRMLTRKMQRRAGPPHAAIGLERMSKHLHRFLEAHIDGPFTVSGERWLAGGASKIQVGFTLDWNDPGHEPTTSRMVVRMEPTESLNATSRLREFQLVNAFAGVVPVPRAHWVDEVGEWFPEPALVYAFADGLVKPTTTTTGRLSGAGTDFGPALRGPLGRQFVEHLATIHTFDYAGATMDAFDAPAVGTTECALWQLNRARRVWEEDRGEDLPLIEVGFNWLERNLPELDHVSVVHGDYRSGNFLFDEAGARITAWLDWERGHLGDRHRDLAWTTVSTFGHYAEDGTTYLVCGLVPLEEFYERYEKASGLAVDRETLRWYAILNSLQLIVSTLGTADRVIRLGRSHQDVLLARIEGYVYVQAEDLRRALEEVL